MIALHESFVTVPHLLNTVPANPKRQFRTASAELPFSAAACRRYTADTYRFRTSIKHFKSMAVL